MDTTSSVRPLWRWRQSGVYLALFAALFSASTLLIDTIVLKNVILHTRQDVAALVYLTLGSWVGVLFNLVYNRLLAKKMDPTFTGEYVLRGKQNRLAILAGITASISTVAYFFVAGKGDPSVLIALNTVTVVWLALYDGIKTGGKTLLLGLAAALLVIFGAWRISYTGDSAAGAPIGMVDILLLIGVSCGAAAFGKVFMKKLAESNVNMVNAAFWRFVWLAVSATIAAPLWALANGFFSDYIALLLQVMGNWATWGWVIALMFVAYFGNTLEALANNHETVSTIAVVKSAQTILAIPFALIGAALLPKFFDIPSDTNVWLVRGFGCLLIAIAIWIVPKTKKS